MEVFPPKVRIFLFVIVTTILLIVLQYSNISKLISHPLVQKQFSNHHGNEENINLQETKEKAVHELEKRLRKEKRREKKRLTDETNEKDLLQSASTQTLDFNFNSSKYYTPVIEPQYTTTFRQLSEPYYPNVFQYDEEGALLYLKTGEMTTMRPGATKELILSAPELFEKIPTRFLDNFKNPCWLRDETELNCLPYFYIIGMYKCATTDVWDKLVAHPDVIKAGKEPHWWGPRRHGFLKSYEHTTDVLRSRNVTGGPDDSSLEWYLNFYKSETVPGLIKKNVTKGKQTYHPSIFGDASISTAYAMGLDWIKQYPNAMEPPYTNADLIRALQPDAKIILMVRNPTQRAISWWWFTHNPLSEDLDGPYSASTLHKEMVKYVDCFNDCLETHSLRYCAYVTGCPYNLLPDIQAGIYHVYLEDWIKAYSRDSILVIRLEDWQTNQVEVYRNLLEFLNLHQLTHKQVEEILKRGTKKVNRRKHEEAYPETVRLLDDFFRPYNEKLVKLMGDNKFLYL